MKERNRLSKSMPWIALLLAVAMITGAQIRPAWGYFTSYTRAEGVIGIHLGDTTTVEERFQDWEKTVVVTNGTDSNPVFVRVAAFAGAQYSLIFNDTTGAWTQGSDGYYYYNSPLDGGASTTSLPIQIRDANGNRVSGITDSSTFNVVVVFESTPVLYQEDGTPYADWNNIVDAGQTP